MNVLDDSGIHSSESSDSSSTFDLSADTCVCKLNIDDGCCALQRYSQGYEESINPFKAFSAKEKQRKYMNMSPADKISIALSRWVLSNKTARLVFVVYLLILHFLIFFVTAHVSHQASSQTPIAEECMHRFAEHMSHLHDTGDHHIPDQNFFDIEGGVGGTVVDSLDSH